MSIPARYARAYAWHKSAYPEQALKEVEGLVALAPDDPYFLELEGQILLESGHPAEAIPPLRPAVDESRHETLIAQLLGHALVRTEDDRYLPEAEKILNREAVLMV